MAAIARVRIPLRSSVTSKPSTPALSLPTPSLWTWRRARAPKPQQPQSARTFTTSQALTEKKFTVDHEWIELSDDGKTGTIGITTYASRALGDVVYVELPTLDLSVSAGDTIGAVESVKSASDILTPVSGTIVAANDVLEEKPGVINKGPEGEGWVARIELAEGAGEEVGRLMDRGYEAMLGDTREEVKE
ncbi:glycine cleavage system H [Physcia stellaris]|nr:glycine cleavage system H [Physcia stellaris]